jgi:hypothetical protein
MTTRISLPENPKDCSFIISSKWEQIRGSDVWKQEKKKKRRLTDMTQYPSQNEFCSNIKNRNVRFSSLMELSSSSISQSVAAKV